MNDLMTERFLRKEAQASLAEALELLASEREFHAQTRASLYKARARLIWSWGLFALTILFIHFL